MRGTSKPLDKKDSGKSAKVNVLKETIAPLTLLRLLENRFENNASERTWTMQLGPIISNDARTDATKYNISDNGHVSENSYCCTAQGVTRRSWSYM